LNLNSRIFAHRGLWLESGLPSGSMEAFKKAFESGFSVELDLRFDSSEIIVQHDLESDSRIRFEDFLNLASEHPKCELALNVKCDGLSEHLKELKIVNPHFYFDMSFPEKYKYIMNSLPVANRFSEFEYGDMLQAKYAWVDCLNDDPVEEMFQEYLLKSNSYEKLIFVSPELHKRNNLSLWKSVIQCIQANKKIGICTDSPLAFLEKLNDYD
jgi:hypothetical protein